MLGIFLSFLVKFLQSIEFSQKLYNNICVNDKNGVDFSVL